MNYLVLLDPAAGELEKILSGTKSMLLKDLCPTGASERSIYPGDHLYFLRNNGDCDLRVMATVSRTLPFTGEMDIDLAHLIKELQSKLQLTEQQYNHWSDKKQALLVEFVDVHKISPIHISVGKNDDQLDWMAIENGNLSTENSLSECKTNRK